MLHNFVKNPTILQVVFLLYRLCGFMGEMERITVLQNSYKVSKELKMMKNQ